MLLLVLPVVHTNLKVSDIVVTVASRVIYGDCYGAHTASPIDPDDVIGNFVVIAILSSCASVINIIDAPLLLVVSIKQPCDGELINYAFTIESTI